MQIENFEYFEDIMATALRLRDVLDDLGTRRVATVEDSQAAGLQFKLLASCFDDVGNALCDGVFIVAS
ncbi:MAG: hypothetical protein E5Y06_10540 [Mesorhizobium sp.]|uniref:hypothetical protein n=1 Tax=Mesorhizobium sp. TaxID=1871066 RepID=UPI0011F451FA|nr:hypothetical protein [Mesorhizobium sp.]TIN95685.1 MAG: hypothetical protein E5Y06_10540 [Mesorhizobium sp.]TJU98496.1 MAG: hypothetical protein E5Y08_13480 [Mesorhizobium sp.]